MRWRPTSVCWVTPCAAIRHCSREDAIEAAWRVVDPALQGAAVVHSYEPHTWGPADADRLIAADGGWHMPQLEDAAPRQRQAADPLAPRSITGHRCGDVPFARSVEKGYPASARELQTPLLAAHPESLDSAWAPAIGIGEGDTSYGRSRTGCSTMGCVRVLRARGSRPGGCAGRGPASTTGMDRVTG
jgi:hypothetical protein